MGPVRRGLIGLALVAPGPAAAEVCDKHRPDWNGEPVSALSEALTLFSSPLSLVLLAATLIALRFRSQWGALAVCVAWSFLVSAVSIFDLTGGVQDVARAEGCVGSPTLFIASVAAICVAMILYTAPRAQRD